jgi:hypothetical protein
MFVLSSNGMLDFAVQYDAVFLCPGSVWRPEQRMRPEHKATRDNKDKRGPKLWRCDTEGRDPTLATTAESKRGKALDAVY